MKPLLSENGSVERAFGVILAAGGASFYLFPWRDEEPWYGLGEFASGGLFVAGLILLAYGYALRKAWNERPKR